MTLIVLTFVVSLTLMLGSYWAFVVYPEQRSKVSLVKRLKTYRTTTRSAGVVLNAERLSHIPALEALLSRRSGLTSRIRQLLTEADVKMTVGAFVLGSIATAALGGVLVWSVFSLLSAALVAAALFATLPSLYVRIKRTKRLRLFEEQFPEALDLLARALRAGHAFSTGIGMVADEIPAPVGAEFRRLYDEQNFGMSLPDAMRAMAARVPVLDARFFVTAVLTQRESGGNLSEVLDNLASVMRDRFKLKRQIRVISAHGRISGWVLSCLPMALAAVLFVLSPDFMRILWEDPWGVRLIVVAIGLQILGTFIISRLVRIEY